MKVNLFIIGAQKSGSSSLFELLGKHPDIQPCSDKEPDLFIKSPSEIEVNLEAYHQLFGSAKSKYLMEASTKYAMAPHFSVQTAETIFNYNPQARILYIIRDPVERIISHHIHAYNEGFKSIRSLNRAVREYAIYINTSRYMYQLKPYLDKFGHDKVLLLELKEVIQNFTETKEQLSSFLNIDSNAFGTDRFPEKNRTQGKIRVHQKLEKVINNPIVKWIRGLIPLKMKHKIKGFLHLIRNIRKRPELKPKTREFILECILPDILELEKFLKKDLSRWYKY